MACKITRLTRELRRVVTIGERRYVVTIGPLGIGFRLLGAKRSTRLPVSWDEVLRDGGLLDDADLSQRPLLAKAMGRGGRKQTGARSAAEI